MLPNKVEDAITKFGQAACDAGASSAYAQDAERERYRLRRDQARAELVRVIIEALNAR